MGSINVLPNYPPFQFPQYPIPYQLINSKPLKGRQRICIASGVLGVQGQRWLLTIRWSTYSMYVYNKYITS